MILALMHSLEKHEYQSCTAAAEHHIHKDKVDCGSLHYLGSNLSPTSEFDFLLKIPGWDTSCDVVCHPLFTREQRYTDANRGPPFLS